MTKLEARGVRCIECNGVDLKKFPDASKNGFGWCGLADVPHFVSVAMSRNCKEFDAAPPEVVAPRAAWAAKLPLFGPKK